MDVSTPADGATVSVPTLTWEPSANAAQYKVTVTGPAGSDSWTTMSTSFTPPKKLTSGSYRWQVQSDLGR